MFFQELPGVSIFELYPSNSLPLLSHIPVERNKLPLCKEVSVRTEDFATALSGNREFRLDN